MRDMPCRVPWGCITLAFQKHKLGVVCFCFLIPRTVFGTVQEHQKVSWIKSISEHMIVPKFSHQSVESGILSVCFIFHSLKTLYSILRLLFIFWLSKATIKIGIRMDSLFVNFCIIPSWVKNSYGFWRKHITKLNVKCWLKPLFGTIVQNNGSEDVIEVTIQ